LSDEENEIYITNTIEVHFEFWDGIMHRTDLKRGGKVEDDRVVVGITNTGLERGESCHFCT
jgi:hypothetical protein